MFPSLSCTYAVPYVAFVVQNALMIAAQLGLCVPRPEPGEVGSSKPKTPQEALKEAMQIAQKYAHPGGEVGHVGIHLHVLCSLRCPIS